MAASLKREGSRLEIFFSLSAKISLWDVLSWQMQQRNIILLQHALKETLLPKCPWRMLN